MPIGPRAILFFAPPVPIPIIIRLTEYNPVIVNMPARIGAIFSFVFKSPVTSPASPPTTTAHNMDMTDINIPAAAPVATKSFDNDIIMPAVAPPLAKLPSTVRSAKSSILYEIYTPMASTAHNNP